MGKQTKVEIEVQAGTQPLESEEVTAEELSQALQQAVTVKGMPAKGQARAGRKASQGKQAKPAQASKQAESSQDASQGKQPASQASQIARAQQTTDNKVAEIEQALQQMESLYAQALQDSRSLTAAQQTQCQVDNLATLQESIQTALKTGYEVTEQAHKATDYPQAAQARDSAKQARADAYQAVKAAQKIHKAIVRASAKQQTEAKKESVKARKEISKVNQALEQVDKARQTIDQYEAMVKGESEYQGMKIVDVPMTQAHADILNQVADLLWADYQGNALVIIPAEIDLTTTRQKALMKQVIEQGYIAQTEQGYTFTDEGLALLQTDWQEVKANFARMLGKAS